MNVFKIFCNKIISFHNKKKKILYFYINEKKILVNYTFKNKFFSLLSLYKNFHLHKIFLNNAIKYFTI